MVNFSVRVTALVALDASQELALGAWSLTGLEASVAAQLVRA
jgi:hypothetical protein